MIQDVQKTPLIKYSITVFSAIVPWIFLTVFGISFPGNTVALVVKIVLFFFNSDI